MRPALFKVDDIVYIVLNVRIYPTSEGPAFTKFAIERVRIISVNFGNSYNLAGYNLVCLDAPEENLHFTFEEALARKLMMEEEKNV